MDKKLKIVFYDGECGLCQRSISFLAHVDKKHLLKFAPINGVLYLSIYYSRDFSLSSLRFYSNGMTFEKSDAFLKIGELLGGWYKAWCAVFKLVPKNVRDKAYDLIATNRRKVKCTLIIRDERFLD